MFDDRSGAVISACERFRYRLWRRWNPDAAPLLFIMLNPSTADHTKDDATIRKCRGFAERLGYGAIEVCNLYAYRARDPRDLKAADYPIGYRNDATLLDVATSVEDHGGRTVVAWGAHAQPARAQQVRDLLEMAGIPPYYLHLTQGGQPSHPLMLPYSCELKEWA